MEQKLVHKSRSKQRLALHALQKQKQIYVLKEIIIVGGFILGGALLRIPMQAVPSLEPITFIAVLAGWLFGRLKGFITGAGALWVSNFFVFGGQGPWTLPQLLAFGCAGFLGSLLRKRAAIIETVVTMLIATLVFDIILNISWSIVLGGNIFLAFALGLPFLAIHLGTNAFLGLFLPKAKQLVTKYGGFNEKNLVTRVLNSFTKHPHNTRSDHSK